MVDRGFGRTEGLEVGQGRAKPRRRPEAQDGDVGKPWASFPLVHAGALQVLVQAECQPPRPPLLVRKDEHGDAARLPVAKRAENDRTVERPNGCSERLRDRPHVLHGSMPEEGQREVEVGGLDRASLAAEGVALPVDERVTHAEREREGAEEAQASMAAHASGFAHL